MDIQAFNTVFGYLMGFWGVAIAIALRGQRPHRPLYAGRAAAFSFVLGVVVLLRVLAHAQPTTIYEFEAQNITQVHFTNFLYLLAFNFMSRFYFHAQPFSFAYEWRRLLFFALASLFVTGLLTAGGVALLVDLQFWLTALLLFISSIVISSTQQLFQHVRTRSEIDELLARGRKARNLTVLSRLE